ncbi:uncharacterized protein LOC127807741 [Diospyros lotus]|uniref:uncharacterized protein LOC127807741 n=1 Tax=Diospyros lotus TaxID=55363 RepID=UPI002256C769|nr:uncharacterized protein LOC127807741 [Diospyros lotus]
MSAHRGRPSTRSLGRGQPAPTPAPVSDTLGESNGGLRQEMDEVHEGLAGIQRTIEMLATNQVRNDQGQEQVQGLESNAGGQLLKNFMALRPPEFYGGINVLAAKNWMLSVEKHLRTMGCSNAQRVQFATFILRGDAERWWESARQRFIGREPSWVEFQEAFNGQFFPDWIREQKTYEFIELVQGSKSMAQYETEFIFLARFALELVSTEAKKTAKFQKGLRADIRHALAGARILDYLTVVQRAYVIERDKIELGNGQRCIKEQARHMRRECPRSQDKAMANIEVKCFRCGQKGHLANNCSQLAQPQYEGQRFRGQGPQLNQRLAAPRAQEVVPQMMMPQHPAAADKPRMQGKVFALTATNAKQGNEIIQASLKTRIPENCRGNGYKGFSTF